MADITVSKSAGFCFGVNRAVKMAYEALEQGKRVATLGPIIHNTDVVNDMIARGARIIEDVSELQPDEYVVIRSHGVGQEVYDAIAKLGNPVIDAALLRNTAGRLGITEISQKRGALFFFISHPNAKQLQKLMQEYYDRIAFNDKKPPYYAAVRLKKGELSVDLMRKVIQIFMDNSGSPA